MILRYDKTTALAFIMATIDAQNYTSSVKHSCAGLYRAIGRLLFMSSIILFVLGQFIALSLTVYGPICKGPSLASGGR